MKYLLLLGMSGLLLQGCATATWDNIEKTVAAAAVVAEQARTVAEAARAKQEELAAKQQEILASVEALSGPLDADGDGDVTIAEAKATYSRLKDTPEGQSLLANWETYAAVLASVLGIGVAKRGGAAVLAKVHATGRALVDADGDGKPDVPA